MRNFARFDLAARGLIDSAVLLREASNPLEEIFYAHRGRLSVKWHHYFELFDRYFSRFRGKQVNVLEIGVFQGGSLQVWKKYFGERAAIHGIDLRPVSPELSDEGITVHIGDQDDASFLKRVAGEMGRIDIVVDDGSHRSPDQILAFETLYPLVSGDGLYVCEDTHTSYWAEFQGGYRHLGSFIEYAKTFVDKLHAWYIEDASEDRDETFARSTLGVSFYDSLVVIEKRRRDEPFHSRAGVGIYP